MTTFSWIVTAMSTVPNGTESDYVVSACYDVIAVDGEYTSKISDAAFFTVKSDQPDFIPYDQLTNDIVVSWIQTQLTPEGVASYESTLQDQINNQINPPVYPVPTPLPWAN